MGTIVDTANAALAELRRRDQGGGVVTSEPLVPGVWFHMGIGETEPDAEYFLPDDALLRLSLRAETPCQWLTLNLAFDDGDLAEHRAIGFAARSRAPRTTVVRACVRSFRGGAFEDVHFPLHLVAFGEESSHADALWTAEHRALMAPADRRILVFFFDRTGFEITLTDLCLFCA